MWYYAGDGRSAKACDKVSDGGSEDSGATYLPLLVVYPISRMVTLGSARATVNESEQLVGGACGVGL